MDDYSSGIDWGAVDIALPDENDNNHHHNKNDDHNKNHSMPFVQSVPQQQQQQQQQPQQQYQQIHSQQQYQYPYTQQYQQHLPQHQQQYHHQQQHKQMYKSQSQNSTVTNTNFNQLPPSSNGIISSNEFHLQQKIEKLQNLIADKDSKLFDLESLIASMEAEATYRITTAERNISNELKATQDELRRVQKEVETKSLTIAKMKKRKSIGSDSGDGGGKISHNGTTSSSSHTNGFIEENENISTIYESKKTKISNVSPKSNTTISGKHSLMIHQSDHDQSKHNNGRLALHLLQCFDNITKHICHNNDDEMVVNINNSDRKDDNQILYHDETKIKHLLQMFASDNTILGTNMDDIYSTSISQIDANRHLSILVIAKELLCLIVARSMSLKDNKSSQANNLRSFLMSLSTLYELCMVNAQVRECIRLWICDNTNDERQLNHTSTTTRIRGLTPAQRIKINVSMMNLSNAIPTGSNNENVDFIWDEVQRKSICQDFLISLSSMINGMTDSLFDTENTIIMNLVQSLKVHCVMFLLILTYDTPRERSTSPCESIWKVLFDYLFQRIDSNKPCCGGLFNLLSSSYDGDENRHNYIIGKQDMNVKNSLSAKNLDNFASFQVLVFHFLNRMMQSSKYVLKSIFETKIDAVNPSSRENDVIIAKLFCAVILDELQMNCMHKITQYLSSCQKTNGQSQYSIGQTFSLAWYSVRCLTLLCESKSGCVILRTQMKVGNDLDTVSAIALIVDLLEICVDALLQDLRSNLRTHFIKITTSCVTFFSHLLRQHHHDASERRGESQFITILSDAERLSNLQASCRMIVHFHPIKNMEFVGGITKKRARAVLQRLD